MKTYLIEKFKSLKSKIELLDQKAEIQKIEDEVKNILCKNPWHVFNDGDQNELYLFDKNNTLSIVYAGKVTKAEWKYVKELKSVEITTKDQIYMLQMAWFENTDLLCMRLYGTDEYCFMIEDKKWDTCGFKQLSDVTNHILAIEKQKEQLRIETEKEYLQKEEEQNFEEEKEEPESDSWKGNVIISKRKKENIITIIIIIGLLSVLSLFSGLILKFVGYEDEFTTTLLIYCGLFVGGLIALVFEYI